MLLDLRELHVTVQEEFLFIVSAIVLFEYGVDISADQFLVDSESDFACQLNDLLANIVLLVNSTSFNATDGIFTL